MTTMRIALPVTSLGCGGGGHSLVERILRGQPGVQTADVNPATEMAYIEYDAALTGPDLLFAVLEDSGIVIMLGFLLQWPTLLTVGMFPVLVLMYVRLARREEREVRAELGAAYDRYAAVTPAFLPRLLRHGPSVRNSPSPGVSL